MKNLVSLNGVWTLDYLSEEPYLSRHLGRKLQRSNEQKRHYHVRRASHVSFTFQKHRFVISR